MIFWLTHIPVPALARQSGMSDKTMHVLAYFVLAFLVWFAISPYEKVRWHMKKVWMILAIVVCYGVVDEILQGRVGRSADVLDFAADLLGVILALILLSILSFWPALLAASAVFVFVISNLSNLPILYPQYYLDTVFHYTAYTAFALIWIQHTDRCPRLKLSGAGWLICSLLVPVGLLILIKGSAPLFGRAIGWIEVATALFGIASAILISYLTMCLSRRSKTTR